MTRRLILTLMIAAVALSGAAAAVASGGTHYAGRTSLAAINGFTDPVSFTLTGTTLRSFSFGTLGCLGGPGGTLPGTSPYLGGAINRITKLTVKPDGSFDATASTTRALKVPVYRDTLSYRVAGRFAHGRSTVAGTITIKQTINEPAVHRDTSCGPVTMTFNATG